MNKMIKEAYESVKMTKDAENKIINKCIDSKKRIRRKRLALAVGIICLFLFLGTRVSAEDFEKLWARIINMGTVESVDGKRYQVYEEVNGLKLNDLSGIPVGKEFVSTIDEVEKMLGIKLLKYNDATSNAIRYQLLPNYRNGLADRVYLRQLEFYTPDIYGWNENIGIGNGFALSMQIISDKADESTILDYLLELNTMCGKKVLDEYYSENLGTKVLIYEYDYSLEHSGYYSLNAIFIYNNIRYVFDGVFDSNPPIDKLKEIIEHLYE